MTYTAAEATAAATTAAGTVATALVKVTQTTAAASLEVRHAQLQQLSR